LVKYKKIESSRASSIAARKRRKGTKKRVATSELDMALSKSEQRKNFS